MGSTTTLTEYDAVQLMLDADERGLRWLISSHASTVAACLIKNYDCPQRIVDDVINEAAYKVWSTIHSFDARKGTLRAWFLCIAKNTLISMLRRDRLRARSGFDGWDLLAQSSQSLHQELTESQQTLRRELARVIGFLSEKERLIVEADLGLRGTAIAEELAQELGTTPATIYTLRCRARTKLRKLLAGLDI